MTIQIEDVKRLKLGPDDILVIKLPKTAAWEELVEQVRASLSSLIDPSRIIICTKDVDIEVIEQEEL